VESFINIKYGESEAIRVTFLFVKKRKLKRREARLRGRASCNVLEITDADVPYLARSLKCR
jgi:hypothetical protein